MTREYDIDEIRQVGASACPSIAASYEELAGASRRVSMDFEGCFGTHALTDTWFDLYKLLNSAIEESAIGIDAMGDTFVEIAEEYEAIESETVVELETLFEDADAAYEVNRVASEKEFQDAAAPTDPPVTQNPYSDAL